MKYPILEKLFEGENPENIFEVGCGVGGFLKDYVESIKNVPVGGIELNPIDLAQAKENFPDYKDNFYVWDALKPNWPVSDKKYDIVFSIGTLILMPYPEVAIGEMLRIGKKVILAELQNHNESYGVINGNYDYGYQYRCAHDYHKQFDRFGVKVVITQGLFDKSIIKTI